MGVRLMNLAPGTSVVALARNAETNEAGEIEDEGNDPGDDSV
jgi:hypothetical protein